MFSIAFGVCLGLILFKLIESGEISKFFDNILGLIIWLLRKLIFNKSIWLFYSFLATIICLISSFLIKDERIGWFVASLICSIPCIINSIETQPQSQNYKEIQKISKNVTYDMNGNIDKEY